MPPTLNAMELVPGNRSPRLTSKRLAGNLLSIAIEISLGILLVSLLFAPVQSYAAPARLDATVPPAHSSTVGPPAAREQVASIDQIQPAPTGSLSPVSAGGRADSRDASPSGRDASPSGKIVNGMVRLPGHVLPALTKATLIAPPNARGTRSETNQPLTLTIILRRDDESGFRHYL